MIVLSGIPATGTEKGSSGWQPASFDGMAYSRLSLSAGTAGSAIYGNQANYGDTAMGNNPYTDSAGAGSNTWGLNYQAITAVLPT